MKILYLLNSDIWGKWTIWNRLIPILKNKSFLAWNDIKIISRQNYLSDFDKYNVSPIPFKSFIPKILTAIPIYIHKKFPSRILQIKIFEYFSIKYLDKNTLDYDLVISYEFSPRLYAAIKKKNPKIKIVQDVPIAWNNMISDLNKKEKVFENFEEKTPEYFLDSIWYVDYFIVPSDFVKKSLIKYGVNKNKISQIPFWVDVDKFKPLEEKNYNNTFEVAFSWNVNNRKWLKYMIKAWKELNLTNAKLNIYGRIYPEVNKYLWEKQKYNIFTHWFVDLTKELNKNYIFLFPSLLEWSAKSTYEALASGLPLITTYNSWSVIDDGKEWFIILTQDVNTIKEKLLYFYNDRAKLEEMWKNARKLSLSYTWENYTENLIRFYNKVLNK